MCTEVKGGYFRHSFINKTFALTIVLSLLLRIYVIIIIIIY